MHWLHAAWSAWNTGCQAGAVQVARPMPFMNHQRVDMLVQVDFTMQLSFLADDEWLGLGRRLPPNSNSNVRTKLIQKDRSKAFRSSQTTKTLRLFSPRSHSLRNCSMLSLYMPHFSITWSELPSFSSPWIHSVQTAVALSAQVAQRPAKLTINAITHLKPHGILGLSPGVQKIAAIAPFSATRIVSFSSSGKRMKFSSFAFVLHCHFQDFQRYLQY